MYDNAKMQHALRFKPLQKPAPIFKIPANFKKPQIFPTQELSFPPENFDRFPAEILHDRVCSAGCHSEQNALFFQKMAIYAMF